MDISRTSKRLGISPEVWAILCCPSCHGSLSEQDGGISCRSCERLFPLVNGIVRFVGAENYASSFGFQWNRYARTQLDHDGSHESEDEFVQRTGFSPHELSGKLVLDVGCGMGRFAEVASRWGARVVGIDLSNAVEAAATNLGHRSSVTLFQADVFSLPFAAESFECIYSIGVLHHTPDCEKAFKALPRLLKPGGSIAVWLYSGYNKWYRFSDVYRKVTHRMSPKSLLATCKVAANLYYVYRAVQSIPLVGRPASGVLRHLLPVCMNSDREHRVLDTFDWYSPKYQSKHTYEQVFRWFESCGLESLRVLGLPISVRGTKPLQIHDDGGVKDQPALQSSGALLR
jgi:ubiquinone/menaquinone biosynthesis C-methylase UbiE